MGKQGKNEQHVFIDTCILEGHILWKIKEKEGEKSFHEIFKNILSSAARNSEIKIKVPYVVVGELCNNLLKEDIEQRSLWPSKSTPGNLLFETLNRKNIEMVAPTYMTYQLAKKIVENNHGFKNQNLDSLVASQALTDPYSSHLITSDSLLLKSNLLDNYSKEGQRFQEIERKRDLEITEEFKKK